MAYRMNGMINLHMFSHSAVAYVLNKLMRVMHRFCHCVGMRRLSRQVTRHQISKLCDQSNSISVQMLSFAVDCSSDLL